MAYTAVPRPGYDLPAPRGRFGDEGPLAAATAALHPNIEHVRIASGGASPLAGLDRAFFLTEQPLLNPCNTVWDSAIREAARSRGLSVLLTGQMGNVTLSWSGIDLLPQLLSRGRLLRWSREAWGLVRRGGFGPGGVLAQSFGPWTPGWLWSGLHKAFGRGGRDTHSYSAIDPSRLPALAAQARERHLDLFPRPRKDGFEARMWVLGRADHGAHHKGALAAFGVDARDPTADRRLIEFCLSVPAEQWLRDGFARRLGRLALADRLPAQVLNQRGKGLQAIDWHEGATAALADIRDEVERQAGNGAASRALDVTRMRGLAADWPTGGWDSNDVMRTYRLAFLRGLAVGHFLRRASGGNA